MKISILKITLIVPLLIAMTFSSFAQSPPNINIAYDEEGNPYMKNEMIVKFHPDLVNLAVIDDPSILTGTVSEFINPLALQVLIDSGYFDEGLGNLTVRKIYPWLNSSITTSETRIGTTIEMPKFWSTFLVYWNESETGTSSNDAFLGLNTLYPAVEYAEPNYLYEHDVLPNDPQFTAGNQASLNPTALIPNADINIDPAWDLTVGRDNTRVGIMDSGINWDHDDFSEDNSNTFTRSRVKGGIDLFGGTTISSNTNLDIDGHGSSCAGIIGAIRNNELGVAGIAGGNGASSIWGVELFAVKINNGGGFTTATGANGITQGATSISSGGLGLHVQNNSWSGPAFSKTLQNAVRFCFRNNCIITATSGNIRAGVVGPRDIRFPSSHRDEWIMKVGANDRTGNRATFSVFDNDLDFIAPGTQDIYATTDANSNSTYTYSGSGTSFSAPHVAGVAALMCSYINNPSPAPNNLAPEDVENLLQRFATDINAAGYDDETGFGRIDAGATLQGIEMPRFEVRHYNQPNSTTNTYQSTNVQLVLSEPTNGLAAGTYIGDVVRVDATFNITQPTGRTIIDVWGRNSSSSLWGGNNPIVPEVNCPLISWNQTSAQMRGFMFHFKTNSAGQNVNTWMPSQPGLPTSNNLALTVYSEDPLATSSVNELPFDSDLARVVPNPSDGNFSLLFNLKSTEDLTIEVLDLSGKVIQSKNLGKTFAGHQNIEIDANQLNSGFYFCRLSTSKGSFTKKINIVK